MQGGLVSLTFFNVLVDNVIITCLAMTVDDQRVDQDRLGETVMRCLGVLYAYDGMLGSLDADWMQHLMNVLVGLFLLYGLAANIAKSKTVICQPGALRLGMFEEAKALKCKGVGDLYHVIFRRRVPCP